jgi:hypothetical protein
MGFLHPCGIVVRDVEADVGHGFPDLSQFRKPTFTAIDIQIDIALFVNVYRANKL